MNADYSPSLHDATYGLGGTCGRLECMIERPMISTGHLGYSWTVEGGIVEVFTDGRYVRRAPISTPLADRGQSRFGREWWPDREPFIDQWRPLTFATIAAAEQDRVAAYAPRTLDELVTP